MRMSKQMMIGLASGSAVCWSAVAAPPPALDRVPEDAAVAFVIPSVQGFMDDMSSFLGKVVPESNADNVSASLAFMQSMLNTPGMNAAGSAAAVMYVQEEEAIDPPIVLILPVSDFGQIRTSLQGEGEGPVYEGQMFGKEVYLKDIGGGYAAAGPMPELVQEFEGFGGHLSYHTDRLGHVGEVVLGSNDATMFANLEILSPYIRLASEQMQDQMDMMMEMMGPQVAQAQPMMELVNGLMTRLAEDGQTIVAGAQFAESGMSFDYGLQFKDETESFDMFAEKGSTAGLLDRLPASEFIFAYAMDASNPGFSKVFEKLSAASAAGGGLQGVSLANMMRGSKGLAGAMGSVPMMGAGLFSNLVTMTVTQDPSQAVKAMGEAISAMNGQSVSGLKYTTAWEESTTEIAGAKVASFQMLMAPDGSPQSQQIAPAMMIMPMMFGPAGGPSGFVAAVDDAVIQTMSQNTPLMEKAIKAARAGNGLGADEGLRLIASKLPADRVFEVYLSVDQVMNTVGPMAAMFGVMPGFEKVDKMLPIGSGASIGGGGALMRTYVPADVISWGIEFGEKMQADEFEGGPEEGGGRPRF